MADTITIIDDRTGKKVTVPLTDGTFPASALRELDPDLRMYDPAFMSTAACASIITFLDGDAGILRYRGYPIEQLAESSTYLEVAYLLRTASSQQAQLGSGRTTSPTTFLHDNVRKRFMEGSHYDAHPRHVRSGLARCPRTTPRRRALSRTGKKQIPAAHRQDAHVGVLPSFSVGHPRCTRTTRSRTPATSST